MREMQFLPDVIEHIYMSEKKSNHAKEKTTSKKTAGGGEMPQKVAGKYPPNENNSVEPRRQQTRTESTTVNTCYQSPLSLTNSNAMFWTSNTWSLHENQSLW